MGHVDAALLQSYKKIFFAKGIFVLAISECFVTPERLYFSMASSGKKHIFFKKRKEKWTLFTSCKKTFVNIFSKTPVVEY